jgi:UDP-glucuronate 4-epimerase
LITTIEEIVGKKSVIDRQPEQPGDVPQTWADITKAKALLDYQPTTSFKDGVLAFYKWWQANQTAAF